MGKNVIYLPTCHSTNDIAAEYLGSASPAEGSLIITSQQTRGRGQRGNSWQAAPYLNLTFSIIVHPHFLLASEQFKLNVAVSLGVARAIQKYMQTPVKVKWPNDIYVNEQKTGGILIENQLSGSKIKHAIIGIGLNVNQTEFGSLNATSLARLCGHELPLEPLLEQLLLCLEQCYLSLRQGHYDALKAEYLQALYRYQEIHPYQTEDGQLFHGQIIGIDPQGRLAIATGPQEPIRYYNFKEIIFLPQT